MNKPKRDLEQILQAIFFAREKSPQSNVLKDWAEVTHYALQLESSHKKAISLLRRLEFEGCGPSDFCLICSEEVEHEYDCELGNFLKTL